MNEPGDDQNRLFSEVVHWINAQAESHRQLLRSRAMLVYDAIVDKAVRVLKQAILKGDFETLLNTEMAIQKLEMEKYAFDESVAASIQKTREDLAEGIRDYRQLTGNPKSYLGRGYRLRDRAGPNKEYPLDTMRKALRSQATRVGNFAKNPMLNPKEKEFHLLRASVLKRAEKLYEELQAHARGGELRE
jgi:hypothetical protein